MRVTLFKKMLKSRMLRLGVTFFLLAYALSRLELDQLREANWHYLILILSASFVPVTVVGLSTVRWLLVVRVIPLQISSWSALQWTMIGHFFNQAFPSIIGGDAVRGFLATRQTGDLPGIANSIALERLIGLVALLALIAFGQPILINRFNDDSLFQLVLSLEVVIFCVLLTPFLLHKIIAKNLPEGPRRVFLRASTDARRLLSSPLLLVPALLLSLVMHGINLALMTILANHLGASVSFLDGLLILPTLLLVASLPISIGGWGVREAGLAVGFTAIGQPSSLAVATSIIVGLANLVSAIPGAVLWSLSVRTHHNNRHAAKSSDIA
jgi:uncharacterized protein (TIRG00374 family)